VQNSSILTFIANIYRRKFAGTIHRHRRYISTLIYRWRFNISFYQEAWIWMLVVYQHELHTWRYMGNLWLSDSVQWTRVFFLPSFYVTFSWVLDVHTVDCDVCVLKICTVSWIWVNTWCLCCRMVSALLVTRHKLLTSSLHCTYLISSLFHLFLMFSI